MNRAVSGVVVVVATIAFVCSLTWGDDKPMSPVDSLLLMASGIIWEGGKPIKPCDYSLSLEPYPTQAGPVTIWIRLMPKFNCENGVELTFDTLDNLTNLGTAYFFSPGVVGDTSIIDLQVLIPSLDTSSLTLRLSGVGKAWEYTIPMSFVSESDTIKFYYGRDRFILRPRVIERPRRVMSARDSIAHLDAEFQPPPSVRIGQYDEQGRFVPMDSIVEGRALDGRRVGHFDEAGDFVAADSVLKENEVQRQAKILTDSIRALPGGEAAWGLRRGVDGYPLIYNREKAKDSSHAYFKSLRDSVMAARDSAKFEEMRELEQFPLEGADRQVISVDGIMYMRRRGESEFRAMEMTSDIFAHSQTLHDSMQVSKGRIFDFTFDLRDSEHFELTKSLIDTLYPSDSAGFYRAVIDWTIYMQLRDRKVPMRKTDQKPRGSRRQDGDDRERVGCMRATQGDSWLGREISMHEQG